VKPSAEAGIMVPHASGRSLVRAMCGSMRRSQRSFIVHSAPRIISALVANAVVVATELSGAGSRLARFANGTEHKAP
jgi:hypothetical protein